MRLIHVVRPFTAVVALTSMASLFGAGSASALTIQSPTEGRIVRDKVTIVVPKSSLSPEVSSSGFIVVKVDGKFVSAVGLTNAGGGPKSAPSSNISFVWDSKATLSDPSLPPDLRNYRDGKHEIVVEGHGPGEKGKYTALEKASVNVVLQNQVQQPNPAPPIKLKYRYSLGQQMNYKFSTTGEIMNPDDTSLSGGQLPIMAEFLVTQSVEDLQGNGAALVRCKVQKEGYTQLFGQTNMLAMSETPFKSVYKIMDNSGRTLEDNVLSTRSDTQVTDMLVWLPTRMVQVGESWPSTLRLRLEGMCKLTDFVGTSKLEALEWEQGRKCAKIVSHLKGAPSFSFIPSGSGPINMTSTAYVAYETGKLIKNTMSMEILTELDQSVIAGMQQTVASATNPSAPPGGSPGSSYSASPGSSYSARFRSPGGGRTSYPTSAPAPPPSGYGTTSDSNDGTGAEAQSTTSKVKIRLVIVEEPDQGKPKS